MAVAPFFAGMIPEKEEATALFLSSLSGGRDRYFGRNLGSKELTLRQPLNGCLHFEPMSYVAIDATGLK
jgi:hypothetical protein